MESEEGTPGAPASRRLANVTSPMAVEQAIAEFDELGRDQFLTKYGFGKSSRFFLSANGRRYDSKAIIGAAHGFEHPELGPLTSSEFSGGDASVRRKLEALGYTVTTDSTTEEWTRDRLLQALGSLNVSSIAGSPAPHKPLLVLMALARWQSAGAHQLSFRETANPLARAIREFVFAEVQDVDPSQPFWRLQTDGIWQVTGDNLQPNVASASPSRQALEQANAVGAFVPGVERLLGSDADLVWDAADQVTATYFSERAQEAMDAVSFQKRPTRVWWVNQGQSFAPERAGGYVWAPVVQKNGHPAQHHTSVSKLRTGDVVLSYSKKKVRSISIVTGSPERRARPSELPEIVGAGEGHYCTLEYFDLDDPIELTEIPDRTSSDGPFDSGGGVLQGYLYRVSESFAERLRSTFVHRWPAGSPFASGNVDLAVAEEHITMRQALAVYVGATSTANLAFSLGDGRWGWKGYQPDYEQVKPGDLILLASEFSGGSPRKQPDEFAQYGFGRVAIGRITSNVSEESGPYWPDEVRSGQVIYPFRLTFELTEERTGTTIRDLEKEFGGPLSEGFRHSATGGGKGVLVALENGVPEPDDHIELRSVVESFAAACTDANLDYGQRHSTLVRAFITSLATKRFVILTGLSGSGKTRLAMALGQWFGRGRSTLIPVRPDWTSPDALFGYENGLSVEIDGQHAWQVPDTLEFMLRAAANPSHPHLLILDEMNLAHVERYFADVLSGMESCEPILPNLQRNGEGEWRAIGDPLPLPSNLFVVGTVNVDETTYMFSPKVLDRANTIEFRVETADLTGTPGPLADVVSGPPGLIASFLSTASTPAVIDQAHALLGPALLELHSLLSTHNREFGHRTFSEALRFAALLDLAGDSDPMAALDLQVLQKVLPKFHGSVREIAEPLSAVSAWAFVGPGATPPAGFDPLGPPDDVVPALPLTFEKTARMTRRLRANHFVSFTE